VPSDSLGSLLEHARSYKDLTATEERELARRIKLGDRAARDRLVESNMRLAFKLSREWVGSGLPREDLVQEAMVGLNVAADKFDPDKGRFTTYATRWIKKSLWDAAYGVSNTIKRPSRLSRTATVARDYLGEHPSASVGEISRHVQRPEKEVRDALDHARVVASTSDDSFREVGQESLDEVASMLGGLTDAEREAISWKHGLYGLPCSLEEASRKMSADPTVPGYFGTKDVARLCRSATRKLREAREPSDDDVICSVDDPPPKED
jgi:RNA polymerase sigma factor (sigma-70 family)